MAAEAAAEAAAAAAAAATRRKKSPRPRQLESGPLPAYSTGYRTAVLDLRQRIEIPGLAGTVRNCLETKNTNRTGA